MTSFSMSWRQLATATATCIVTFVVCVTLHELVHLWVGRLFDLPTHFINLTAAGVSDTDAATAPALALAWMNGVAPLFTMACGVGALFAAEPARRRGWTDTASVLAWIAIFGVPYIGAQMMLAAAPASLRGNGADSAAVLVGYFGIAGMARLAIVLIGTLIAMAAGFWLPRAIVPIHAQSARVADSTQLGRVPGWRCVIAGLFVAIAVGFAGLGSLKVLRHPDASTPGPFLLALVAWSLALALRATWTSPGARFVRDQWIAPAAVASVVLGVLGVVFPSDYSVTALILLPQLLVAAFASQTAVPGELSISTQARDGSGLRRT
jgi:hypothetical protein